jgi:DNA-directed RNA polymerase specialized sigma24 family protein
MYASSSDDFRQRGESGESRETSLANQSDPVCEQSRGRTLERRTLDAITEALGELAPPLRAAIILTVIQKLSLGEVTNIEGCSPESIRRRVCEARRILKHHLMEYLQP